MNSIDKPILDACCGGRMFYFDKSDERVLFQDIRDEEALLTKGNVFKVHPDVVCDFTSMPYPDNTFRMVVFDPPHMVYYNRNPDKNEHQRGDLYIEYGELHKDWREMLSKGFEECFRVLRPGGFLIFKWSDTDIKLSSILSLTPYKPIFGHRVGKAMNTHWMCFMKESEVIK